jgi:hypothetical protein
MESPDSLIDHLLSHRLRGFDHAESTRLGLQEGLNAGVRHVEFDVRFTKGGCPVAYHDPFFMTDNGSTSYIDEWSLAALRSQRELSDLATLEDMCKCFADFHRPDAFLHVDVKVSGYESIIHDTIAKFGLLSNTVLVSWLPEVLVSFHSISPLVRLCFSHIPLAHWLYNVAKTISPVVQGVAPSVGKGLQDLFPILANEAQTVRLYFHDNGDVTTGNPPDSDPRATPGHVIPGVLTGPLLDLLRKTAGLVCVPLTLATQELRESYRSLGIQFAVYSVADFPSLEDIMVKINPDIVYVDSADIIRKAAEAAQTGRTDQYASPSSPAPMRQKRYPFG